MEKTKIAFICVHNSCRSQMAEAFGKAYLSDKFECYSAGTETKPVINQDAVRIMKEHFGIDMKGQYSKLITDIPTPDIVITMGCNVHCPNIPCKEQCDWGLDDPTGKSDEEFIKTANRIKEKILDFRAKPVKTNHEEVCIMNNITEHIRSRRSVRTFDGRELSKTDMEKLTSFAKTIENPFKIPVDFKLLNAKEHGLNCPVTVGTDLFVGGKIKCTENASVAFGYSFEMLVLYAQSLGIGTVWLGGTMNRAAFEEAMELDKDEIMPCASPLGYPAKKMSIRESMMRKAIKADERLPFEELFFDRSFDTPLTKEKTGMWAETLEMVKLAPSAVNKQPWRVIVADNAVHFYLKRSKGFSYNEKLDMQKIDIGIALCHFDLTAKENNLNVVFEQNDPKLESDAEYIASFRLV